METNKQFSKHQHQQQQEQPISNISQKKKKQQLQRREEQKRIYLNQEAKLPISQSIISFNHPIRQSWGQSKSPKFQYYQPAPTTTTTFSNPNIQSVINLYGRQFFIIHLLPLWLLHEYELMRQPSELFRHLGLSFKFIRFWDWTRNLMSSKIKLNGRNMCPYVCSHSVECIEHWSCTRYSRYHTSIRHYL